MRVNESEAQESSYETKQKSLERTVEQINTLVLTYTSPDNAEGVFMSDDEYKAAKSSLNKQRAKLEKDLETQGKVLEEWIELSERTFNYARYARLHFIHGDMEQRRAIFASLGSNLLLKNKEVSLELHKPFKYIFEQKENVEIELSRLEPVTSSSTKRKIEALASEFPITSG